MKELSVFVFDDAPFTQRLTETVTWCHSRGDPDDPRLSLRSDDLRPWLLAPDRLPSGDELARAVAVIAGVEPPAAAPSVE